MKQEKGSELTKIEQEKMKRNAELNDLEEKLKRLEKRLNALTLEKQNTPAAVNGLTPLVALSAAKSSLALCRSAMSPEGRGIAFADPLNAISHINALEKFLNQI